MSRKQATGLAILTEGDADTAFIQEMAKVRGNFPDFFYFPHDTYSGHTAFGLMLGALKGNPRQFEQLRAVLIMADSKDAPEKTFEAIQKQVRKEGGYRTPEAVLAIAPNPSDDPGVFVMLLPDEKTPGALESLYASAMLAKDDWRGKCVNDYLQCGKSDVANWSQEKQAKAKFHALVAASYERDPSKAASKVFQSQKDNLIDIKARFFDDAERRLRQFCKAAEDMS